MCVCVPLVVAVVTRRGTCSSGAVFRTASRARIVVALQRRRQRSTTALHCAVGAREDTAIAPVVHQRALFPPWPQ